MTDDPLGLVVQAILVLAAGMYPVGFLFGTCSDCCCPPCNVCNHHYDGRSRFDADFASIFSVLSPSLLLTVEGQSDTAGVEEVEVVLTGLSFDTGMTYPDTTPVLVTSATFTVQDNDLIGSYNSCNCVTESKTVLRLQAYLDVGGGGYMIARTDFDASPFFVIGDSCEQDSATLDTVVIVWESIQVSGLDANVISQQTLDWLAGLDVSGTFTFSACDCGACCIPFVGGGYVCTDDVAEGFCQEPNNDGEAARIYRGDDTTCEDEGCPIGSCCDELGDCTQTFEVQCAGTWTLGESCDPNPCPQPPEGACCIEGECTQTTEANCAGVWSEGVECDPNPCEQPPLGACCDAEGNCTQTTQADCTGVVWREGIECGGEEGPDPCLAGTCCVYDDGVFDGPLAFYEDECISETENITVIFLPGEQECPPTNP